MSKIVFFDIDGTLIDVPNHLVKPTTKTVQILKEFQNQGNYIVIASARGKIPDCLNEIAFDGMIGCDGHYIEFHDEIFVNHIFTVKELDLQNNIYEYCHGAYILSGHFGDWYSDANDELVKRHLRIYNGTDQICDNYNDNWQYKDVKANVVTAIFDNTQDLYEAKSMLPEDWAVNLYDKEHIHMDVHKPGFSKGTACEFLYQKLGIKKEDSYAFGDGFNDIEMLKRVGHGVAMGNAVQEAKNSADYITRAVGDDGIAYAFHHYFGI